MIGRVVMPGSMPVRGGITTADMAALEAQPQVHPGRGALQTFFAPVRCGGLDLLDACDVGTGRHVLRSRAWGTNQRCRWVAPRRSYDTRGEGERRNHRLFSAV